MKYENIVKLRKIGNSIFLHIPMEWIQATKLTALNCKVLMTIDGDVLTINADTKANEIKD